MSGTVYLVFKDKETCDAAQKWFKKVCAKDRYPDLEVPRISDVEVERGLYTEFNEEYRDPYTVSFDYAIWDDEGRSYANILCREICKHFDVVEAGWDSVGPVPMNEFLNPKKTMSEYYRKRGEELKAEGNDTASCFLKQAEKFEAWDKHFAVHVKTLFEPPSSTG